MAPAHVYRGAAVKALDIRRSASAGTCRSYADQVTYPTLDREAARRDPSVIDQWEQKVELLYKAELAAINMTFGPQDDAGRETALRDWEYAARGDREWADGYRRGLADARLAELSARQGPGVMANDPKDGWSPSLERTLGYENGLQDGNERRT